MAKHAKLSASAAERWMNCPGSVALQPKGRKSSRAAAEGTFAHGLAGDVLEGKRELSTLLGTAGEVEGFSFVCDEEMVDAIKVYVDAVAPWMDAGHTVRIEASLTKALKAVDEDLGGTGDFVSYRKAENHLLSADFKYGSGTYVAEEDNRQLMIYALGALLSEPQPTKTVTVMIIQPRYEGAEPVRTWTFDAFDLLEFQADLKDAAARTRLPDAPTVAGTWCRKTFCAAAAHCPATLAAQHALVAAEFTSVTAYDPQDLAKALAMVPVVKERIKQLEEFAYAEATRGAEIPGYKLVDKVARRKWSAEEAKVAKWAESAGIEPYERSLKSPAQLEKGLTASGKKDLAELWTKESSGTTLVVEDDKRPAVKGTVSADDFSDVGGAEGTEVNRLNLFE